MAERSLMRNGIYGGVLIAAAVALAVPNVWAQEEARTLHDIMEDLGEAVEDVTEAISHENWVGVETLAARIADHPQPAASEKARILGFLGKDAAAFRQHDRNVHEAARTLGQAAAAKDGKAVIAAFSDVQTACLGCHQQFRNAVMQHLHSQP
jgi:cytochrome c556